jgi:hypothetical protein
LVGAFLTLQHQLSLKEQELRKEALHDRQGHATTAQDKQCAAVKAIFARLFDCINKFNS